MKKVFSLVLAIFMLCSTCATALADAGEVKLDGTSKCEHEFSENIVPREELFEHIELLAQRMGLLVTRNRDGIAVSGRCYFVIWNDEVIYGEANNLKREVISYDGVNVKYPEDAIEAFFGIELNGKTVSDIVAEEIFELEETEECVIIKGLKIDAESIVIPGILYGKKVKIAEGAFENNVTLKEVTVMEGIEEIPKYCFYWATNLEKVTLPESIVLIGERSFLGCDIEEVDIKNVKDIDTSAFAYCNKLKKVKSNSLLEKIGNEAFYGCSLLSEIDLSNVKILEGTPFLSCFSLKTVTLLSLEKWDGIKDNEAEIETGRHHIKQPEARHGGMVFYHGLSPMVKAPFKNCTSLETVTVRYPDNKTGEAFPSLFVDCPNIKSFTIENYQPNLSRWEFSNLTYDNRNGYVFVGNAPEDLVIYSDDWSAEKYAEKLGVKFSYIKFDADEQLSVMDDDYILSVDDISGDSNAVIIEATVFARNKDARQNLMNTPVWDFNIEYETENGWSAYGGLTYEILEGKKTENSISYRLTYTISYKDNTRFYKNVRLSSDYISVLDEEEHIVLPYEDISDEIQIPLTGQWYEGGTIWVSRVSLTAVVGVEDTTDRVVDGISESIKFKLKDGTIKECMELYGKSHRSSFIIWNSENPRMYEFSATANNKVVNLDKIESVIVNNVEYNLENPENYTYINEE